MMASHTQSSRRHVITKRTFTENKDDKTKAVDNFTGRNVITDQNSAASNSRCSTSLEQNGTQKQNKPPINQNFSSRNSLRSAQSFTRSNINHSNQMFFPVEKIHISELGVYNNFIPDLNIEANPTYEVLMSDGFLRFVNKSNEVYLYCMLCGRKERMQTRSAIELHLTCDDHNSNLFSLRNRLLDQTPSSTSLQMNAVAALLISWYDSHSLTSDSIISRLEIINQFNTVLDMVNPECKLRILGSLAVGTSLFSSDINLELIHPNSRLFEKDPRAKNSIHHKLIDPEAEIGSQINNHTLHYDLIPNAIDTLYTTMNVISTINQDPRLCPFEITSDLKDLNRKIPRLVLRHSPTKTSLEICCYAGPRYDLSTLLNTYLSLDKRARVLSILIKYWSQQCNIDKPEQGTLPPEAFVIMTIYYLQRLNPPILPCLHELLSKGGTKPEAVANQENTLNDAFNKMDLTNCRSKHGVTKEPTQSNNLRKPDLESLDIDNGEEELDDEEDEDAGCADLDQEDLKNISWTSSNTTSLPQLFIDYLFMMMKEFDDSSSVITIRTLKKVTLQGKSWATHVKAIEHPLRPKINISRCIGTVRTFEYIKKCFRYGYYYLTSIPLDTEFKQKQEHQTDPKDYIELYMNLDRFDAYYRMRGPSLTFERSYDSVSELIQQNIFARDIIVVNALIERSKDINFLPHTVANFFQIKLIIPKDVQATIYCTLCRNIGHTRSGCPRAKLDNLELESRTYDPSLDDKANFDKNFLAMYKIDEITPRLFRDHELVVSTLTSKINQRTGLNSRLQLFGSTVNHLGSRDSDLDICMTLADNPTGKGVDCVEVLRSVQEVLDKMSSVEDLEPILSARVPILKFKYEQRYEIDLSMYNLCATYNSKLLKAYSEIDDRVGKLFYLVKKYARGCGIADASRGSLSSYAWSLMVIHYLQRTEPPILPVLQETDDNNEKKLIGVNGWNVWFKKNIRPVSNPRNNLKITSLFKGFLLYYGNFDFNFYVVSIRKLAPVTRFQKNWNHCMMAIEDPFELTYNLASRLDDPMAIYIINSFSLAYRHIVALQEKHIKLNGISPPPNFVVQKIFNGKEFMGFNPPYRGCRHCHRIGHKFRDCPEKRIRPKRSAKQQQLRNNQPTGPQNLD